MLTTRILPLAGCLAFAAAGAAPAVALAPAVTAAAGATATAKITPTGVGAVKVGARYATLRAAHRLGKIGPGCELAGPRARAADLVAPLKGSVTLTDTSPRKVATIAVRGGATARGIGVGSTASALRRAFPKATFDHGTEQVFAITLVTVPKGGGGRLQLAVDVHTRKVTSIGIPSIPFCD